MFAAENPIPFSTFFLNRASARRPNKAWLDTIRKNETTLYIPVWQQQNLVISTDFPQAVFINAQQVEKFNHNIDDEIFLGFHDNRAYFAIAVSMAEDFINYQENAGFEQIKKIASMLPEDESALLAFARAMVYWHYRHQYCGVCGNKTRSDWGGNVRICTSSDCNEFHYPRIDPAIIVLVSHGERCLLGRKAEWPAGMFSTLAGFVEPGETLEDAVKREVFEESGIRVDHIQYQGSQPWPFPSSIMLGFNAVAQNENIKIDEDELERAHWFSREDIMQGFKDGSLRSPSHHSIAFRLIESWFNMMSTVRFIDICASITPAKSRN